MEEFLVHSPSLSTAVSPVRRVRILVVGHKHVLELVEVVVVIIVVVVLVLVVIVVDGVGHLDD